MISDSAARPIANHVASKSFRHIHDPNKLTIQQLFHEHWDDFLKDPEVVRRGFRFTILEEVDKMLVCGTLESGYEIFECLNCNKSHIICYMCKSRFYNSCGSEYTKQRAASTLDVNHRHVFFTRMWSFEHFIRFCQRESELHLSENEGQTPYHKTWFRFDPSYF